MYWLLASPSSPAFSNHLAASASFFAVPPPW